MGSRRCSSARRTDVRGSLDWFGVGRVDEECLRIDATIAHEHPSGITSPATMNASRARWKKLRTDLSPPFTLGLAFMPGRKCSALASPGRKLESRGATFMFNETIRVATLPDACACRTPPRPAPPARGSAWLDERLAFSRKVIELAVTRVFDVDQAQLCAYSRGVARAAHARQVAMYLGHVACRLSLTDVGRMFGRDRTTVAHACAVIEDARDDPAFDRALDLLEWAVPVMAARMSSSTTTS